MTFTISGLLQTFAGRSGPVTRMVERLSPRRLIRAALPLAGIAAVAAPGAAHASALCTAVNNGVLDYTTTYANGQPTTPNGARFTAANRRRISAVQADGGTTDPLAGTAAFDNGGPYGRLASGEVITIRYTLSGYSNGTQFEFSFRRGTGTNTVTNTGTGANLTANGTGTITYTATGSETMLSTAVAPVGASINATATFDLSCAATTPPPAISGVSPTTSPTAGGIEVTITGTNFTGVDGVTFDATEVQPTSVTPTQVRAIAPAHAPGAVAITVSEGAVTSAAFTGFSYVASPAVTAITPTAGPATGGNVVTIDGINFAGATAVLFGGTTYSTSTGAPGGTVAQIVSDTRIQFVAVAGTGGTTTNAQVTTGGGTSPAATANQYTFRAAPTITGVSPPTGPTFGGTSVTIAGSGFTGASGVTFGGTAAASFTVNTDGRITATTPSRTAGTVNVAVAAPGGTVTATGAFTFVAPPTVIGVSPGSGPAAGGTQVTIAGSNFDGATAVRFGGVPAQSYVINTTSQITAVTPAGSAGAADVAVVTAGGTGTLASGYTYVALAPPAVTAQPANQTVAVGATATFTAAASGTPSPTVQWQVSSDSGATFGAIAGATSTSYTTPATGPADNGKLFRAVFTNSQDGGATTVSATSNAATLTVVRAPTANGQSVGTGFNTARTITLTGSDPNTPVRALTYTVTSAPAHGTLTGTAPNLTYTPTTNYAGPDSFTFTASNGLATSSPATVSITVAAPAPPAPPTVTAPADGAVTSDATPTVTGTIPAIADAGAGGPTVLVYFDGTLSGGATVTGSTFTYTPSQPLGEGAHSVYAVVSNLAGPSPNSNTNRFTVDTTAPAPPTIATPANGATIGTRRPVLTGTAESGATVSFTVNGSPAGSTVATGGSYSYTPVVDLPLGTDTIGADATDPAGNRSTTTYTTVTVVAQPSLSGVSPPEGPTAGGTGITVTGSNLTGVTAVTVGGVPATNVTVTSSTSLTARTPAGTRGAAAVVVSNAAGSSAGGATFTYVAPPVADAQSVDVPFRGQTRFVLTGTDPQGRPLTYSLVTGGTKGSITGTAPNLTYSANSTARGTDTATFRASNGVSDSAPATLTFTIADPVLTLTGPAATGTLGSQYSSAVQVSGGTAPYIFRRTGTLPPGLTLQDNVNSTGTRTLTGTPTAGGSYTFTIQVQDSTPGSPAVQTSQTFTITIAKAQQTIEFTSPPPSGAVVGGSYVPAAIARSASGPTQLAPTFSINPSSAAICTIAGGTVSFRQAGTCVIDADQAGDANYDPAPTVQQRVAVGAPTITVSPATLPPAQVGATYAASVVGGGGTPGYRYAVTVGALPAGLALDAGTGAISGTPTQGGTVGFTITATDSTGGAGAPFSGRRAYTLTVAAPTIAVAPPTLPNATRNIAYSQQLTASGGTAPYSFSPQGGPLPAGLTLAANGTLSGTPTQQGSFTFTVAARDSSTGTGPYTGTRDYTLTVAAPVVAITPATLPNATVRVAYNQVLTASGGTGPYGFALASGRLPAGIRLSSGGTLNGAPTEVGTFTFEVRATDANGNPGTQAYALTVATVPITITPASLPDATVDTGYAQQLSASGGSGSYLFEVTAGALPGGLVLAPDGALSGAPDEEGSYTFTVTATEQGADPAASGSREYTLAVVARADGLLARAWVSGVGDDANPCTRTAPCKTFAGAFPKVTDGGEISCLDAAGYGGLTITRSLTIACGDRAGRAGIIAAGTGAVTVNAPAGARVVLSGLDLDGLGNSAMPGINGIRVVGAGSVLVRNTTIRGFRGQGVAFAPGTAAQLDLVNVRITDSGSAGDAASGSVLVAPTGGGTARVTIAGSEIANSRGAGIRLDGAGGAVVATVVDSVVTGSAGGGLVTTGAVQASVTRGTLTGGAAGVSTGTGGTVTLAGSSVTRNAVGIAAGGGATRSAGGNTLAGNTADGAFSGTVARQ